LLHRRIIKGFLCIISVGLAALVVGGMGCSGQGEGERCTFFANAIGPDAGSINGSSECQDGLVCVAAFNTSLYPFDRCCPSNLDQPTNVPACYSGNNVGTLPEASTQDVTTDAPPDSPKDSPSDSHKDSSAGDAHKDAPATDGMSDGASES
jgi:hypothetical protein